MTAPKNFGSHAFDIVARGTIALHKLIAEGRGDEPEAEAVRDSLDKPLASLSQIERERAQMLSEDLYSLSEFKPDRVLKAASGDFQTGLLNIYNVKERQQLDIALNLIRRWQDYMPLPALSFLRGSTWASAGNYDIAAAFYANAAKIDPMGICYPYYLDALNKSNHEEARYEAEKVVRSPADYTAPTVIQAAHVLTTPTGKLFVNESRESEMRLIPVVDQAMKSLEPVKEQEPEFYMIAALLLGRAYQYKGDSDRAYECYSRGLSIDPNDDTLLTLRGMLMYGINSGAISDLQLTIELGSKSIWPYFFLAHHNLANDRFDDCRKFCERALDLQPSETMRSELLNWLAIAEARLSFPVERVRRRFEDAIRHDPSNDLARQNLSTFMALTGQNPSTDIAWDKRTAPSLRAFGIAEYDLDKSLNTQIKLSA